MFFDVSALIDLISSSTGARGYGPRERASERSIDRSTDGSIDVYYVIDPVGTARRTTTPLIYECFQRSACLPACSTGGLVNRSCLNDGCRHLRNFVNRTL